MAERLNPESGNAQHDMKARAGVITSTFAEMYDLEENIAAAVEKHVEPMKKLRTKKWRAAKKDLDITREVLELEYKQYKLARRAQEDEEDTSTLDNMREVFSALHPGGQLDWVGALADEGSDVAKAA